MTSSDRASRWWGSIPYPGSDTVRVVKLNDAQAMADEYPSSFHAPDPIQLEEIDVGYSVVVSNNYDRFWVKITAVDGQRLTGTIDNELVGPHGKLGETIELQRRHVYRFRAPAVG